MSLLQLGSDYKGNRTPTSPIQMGKSPIRRQLDVAAISSSSMQLIRRRMADLARELAQNEELGLDEAVLVKFFETKTKDLLLLSGSKKIKGKSSLK